MISDLSEATPEQLLSVAHDGVLARRRLEVEQLQVVLAWADLHSGDPQDQPDAIPVRYGGPRLIALGGDGTPQVCDLALVELAIARHEHVLSTRRVLADAFDLRHRLPQVWAGARALRCEAWVIRKVAAMSRRLTAEQVVIVDNAVAAALDEAPSRIIAIAEAKIIEADQAAHAERIEKNREQKGVWYPTPRPGDQVSEVDNQAGIGIVFARLDEGDALTNQRFVEDLAVALAEQATPEEQNLGMDHWRAEAFAMLADPAAVLGFLAGRDDSDDSEVQAVAQQPSRDHGKPTVELVIHLAQDQAGGLGPVARVEGLGPRLLAQVRDLLTRHTHVSMTPVIDLHAGRSVNAYEHPTDVKRRSELRMLGDVFPHATSLFKRTGRPPDHDHTRPYVKDGPPGQTGDHNDTPLVRHHHRTKTHVSGWRVLQLGPDRWVWGTPHGLFRLVASTGTTTLTQAEFHVLAGHAVDLADDFAA